MSSIKKHVRHMTKAEMNYLISKARTAQDVKVTKYTKERLKQRGGTKEDILHVLRNGYLIEYHKKDGKNRVLLRGVKRFLNDVLCVVFELDTNQIITVYWNRYDDNHYTLNESAYNRYVNILKEIGVA